MLRNASVNAGNRLCSELCSDIITTQLLRIVTEAAFEAAQQEGLHVSVLYSL